MSIYVPAPLLQCTVETGYRGKVGQRKIVLYNQVSSVKRVAGFNNSDVNEVRSGQVIENV